MDEILELYVKEGLFQGQWEVFNKCQNYEALLVKRRIVI